MATNINGYNPYAMNRVAGSAFDKPNANTETAKLEIESKRAANNKPTTASTKKVGNVIVETNPPTSNDTGRFINIDLQNIYFFKIHIK